jgi:hypothetical protein
MKTKKQEKQATINRKLQRKYRYIMTGKG